MWTWVTLHEQKGVAVLQGRFCLWFIQWLDEGDVPESKWGGDFYCFHYLPCLNQLLHWAEMGWGQKQLIASQESCASSFISASLQDCELEYSLAVVPLASKTSCVFLPVLFCLGRWIQYRCSEESSPLAFVGAVLECWSHLSKACKLLKSSMDEREITIKTPQSWYLKNISRLAPGSWK